MAKKELESPHVLNLNINEPNDRNWRTELWYAKWTRSSAGGGDAEEEGWFVVACFKWHTLDVAKVIELIKRINPHDFSTLSFSEVRYVAVPNYVASKRGE